MEKYFSRRTIPYWGVLIFDSVIVLLSLFMAHVINSGLIATLSDPSHLVNTLVIYLICYLILTNRILPPPISVPRENNIEQ